MFRKSRQKIVAVILAVLIFLLVGTLCVIYGSSYIEVYRKNQDMLAHHIEVYEINAMTSFSERPEIGPGPDHVPNFNDESFQLSTFYSVLLHKDGSVLDVDNISARYSDEELTKIARKVSVGKQQGTSGSLVYQYKKYGDFTLVAFMDNAIMQESITTLFRYTLIFGGISIVFMFFLAVLAAKKIVAPLEESYQKQKQFISDAGHELKTPVSVINANVDILQREIGENGWLANIQHENARMGLLVSQLLELARTEQVTPEMSEVALSRLVMGEALPFESVAYEKGLKLTCDIAEDIHVTGNTEQLAQLVSILIDNGIRHSERDGTVQIRLHRDQGAALLSVSNDGDPIPEEERQLLFERFYRADRARTGEDNRYGLGLAIAKAIIDSHQGSIKVCCHDHTVEFCVQIPLL